MKIINKILSKNYFVFGVLSFYILVAVIFSYPVVSNISKNVWGYSGDNFGVIWTDWWFRYAEDHHTPKNFTPLVNYPFGTSIDLNSELEPAWTIPTHLLSRVIGEVASFNIIIFLSFPLAGITMFLLLELLTKNRSVSLVGGLIYMLLPYHFWQSYQHISLAQIQWLPLYLYALFRLDEKLKYKYSIFTGVSFALVTLSSVYHGYFTFLFTGVYVLLKILYQALFTHVNYLGLKRIKVFVTAAFVALIFVFPVYFSVIQAAKQDRQFGSFIATGRPLSDLLSFSTRPWDFVIPPRDQPFLGKFEEPLYNAIKKMSNDYKTISAYLPERVVYIGIPSLLFALLGIFSLIKRGKRELAFIVALGALSLYIVASPPFIIIKGITIYFPSFFLYKFFPVVRVYSRMGILIDLLVIILAAFGFLFILNKIKTISLKRFFTAVLIILFLFEFLNFPPYHYTDMSKLPATYQWLKDHPDGGAFIEYPQSYSLADSLFFQIIHQHSLINIQGLIQLSPYGNLATIIKNPVDGNTAAVLAALGLKYAVIHSHDPYNRANPFDETSLTQVLEAPLVAALQGNGVAGFNLEDKLSDGAVLKITSEPGKIFIIEDKKVSPYPPQGWVWQGPSNSVYLINSNTTPVKLTINFPENLAGSIKITDQDKKVVNGQVVVNLEINGDNAIKRFDIQNLTGKELNLSGITVTEVK